ncbi:MAG: nuclear transport factor 2 family protein [Proteobacteria bacterium]|nr:nuclear transport factor 2 family protein [Pseudomonadota bacterium]
MNRFLVLAVLLLLAAPVAAADDDLMALDRSFSAAVARDGLPAAYLAYLAEDAADFGAGNMPPLYGRAAYEASVRAGHAENPPGSSLVWSPEHMRLSADRTMGAVDGTWTYTGPPPKNGAKPFVLTGHYLRVWHKDAAGAWKIADEMATTDTPPKP